MTGRRLALALALLAAVAGLAAALALNSGAGSSSPSPRPHRVPPPARGANVVEGADNFVAWLHAHSR